MKTVSIIIRGGVAYVEEIPKGIQVKITDYDNDEEDRVTFYKKIKSGLFQVRNNGK